MMCPFPLHLRVHNSSTGVLETIDCPCGKCDVCKRNKMNDWLFRLQYDVDASVNAFFVTLTYNEDNLPQYVKLDDVQRFFKRLRKRCYRPGNGHPAIQYFLCSEYGSLRNRPHYHAIILNIDPLSSTPQEAIEQSWHLGFVYIGSVTSGSLRYVLKYIQKDAELSADKLKSLFYVMSKGIGKEFLTISNGHNKSNVYNRRVLSIDFDGVRKLLPRYYQTKIFGDERRSVSDNSRNDYLSSIGAEDVYSERYKEYQFEKRQFALSFIDAVQRRKRLDDMGIRSAGKP